MSKIYIPERGDIILLDFEPKKGQEIGKYHPALILSSKAYQKKSGLLICCPVSTSIRGHITEVLLDCLDKPSVIAAGLIQTLDWGMRKAKFITKVDDNIIREVLFRLLPLIGGELL